MEPYRILRSDRQTLRLEISREGEFLVRAPRLLPESEIRRFVAQNAAWIESHQTAARERWEKHPEPSPEEAAALRARARRELPGRVQRWAAVMGVHPTGITITGARTRFGSCSPRNRLSFSWRLLQYPEEAVDYVVVHELAHILHHDHSPAFYAAVAAVLPDHRERRALLR